MAARTVLLLHFCVGAHPRIGALDVCPFIPVSGITPQECVEQCAHVFSQRASSELNIPIYLYGAAASEPKREELANIRSGGYEGLPEKIKKPEWKPDYGPAEFVPSWGASVVGVRKFLIAYNVNLLSTKEQAHRIALNVRTAGRGAKDVRYSLSDLSMHRLSLHHQFLLAWTVGMLQGYRMVS